MDTAVSPGAGRVRGCAMALKQDVFEGFRAVSTKGVCGCVLSCWKRRGGHSLDPTVKPIDGAGATRCEGGEGGGSDCTGCTWKGGQGSGDGLGKC
jgi:hypothetical protein